MGSPENKRFLTRNSIEMQLIETGDKLINALSYNLSLISSQLYKVCIYNEDNLLYIDVGVELMYKNENNRILLRFVDVKEYSFYYSSHRIFYNIEAYKFFKSGDLYYASFDPVDESEVIADNDQDYIKSKSVNGYFV